MKMGRAMKLTMLVEHNPDSGAGGHCTHCSGPGGHHKCQKCGHAFCHTCVEAHPCGVGESAIRRRQTGLGSGRGTPQYY
jgi:hypothetical protein